MNALVVFLFNKDINKHIGGPKYMLNGPFNLEANLSHLIKRVLQSIVKELSDDCFFKFFGLGLKYFREWFTSQCNLFSVSVEG